MRVVSKHKSEIWTANPQSDSEERLRIYNIVRQKIEPTRCAYHSVDDIASSCSLFFRDSILKLKDRWKQLDPKKTLIIIVTLLLIGVYKSKE